MVHQIQKLQWRKRKKKKKKTLIPVCFTGRMLSGIDSYMVKTVIMKTSGGKWFNVQIFFDLVQQGF